jgi:hypothetical protein
MRNLALVMPSLSTVIGEGSSPFLNEILLGRCYFRPPDDNKGSPALCPEFVESFMAVLEGNRDDEINPNSFSEYVSMVKVTAANTGAVFWLSDYSQTKLKHYWSRIPTPENTPGGAMMKGLRFCGVDKKEDCQYGSGASSSFWIRIYSEYSKLLRGNLHIILGDDA